MMGCPEARNLMVLYIGGLLDPLRRVELESHVDVCAQCQQEYELIRVGLRVVLELCSPVEVDTEGFVAKIVGVLPEQPPARVSTAPRWMGVVAGLAILLGLAVSVGSLLGVGKIEGARGGVSLLRMAESEATGVGRCARLYPGDRVETRRGGVLRMKLGGKVYVKVGEQTSLRMIASRAGLAANVEVAWGEVEVVAWKDIVGFTVFTPAGRLQAVGTKFKVRVEPDGGGVGVALVTLEVFSGKVEWSGDWGLETVPSGAAAVGKPGTRPTRYPIEPYPDKPGPESPSPRVEAEY